MKISKDELIKANGERMEANELIANVIFYLTALKKWFVYRLKMIANLKPRLVILNGIFRLLYPIRWNSLIRLNSLRIRSYSLKKRLAQVVLASQLLNLLLPFTGLVSPLQANNLIKPTQKGDSLFESVNPGFKAEFGDKEQPTQHRLRFESKPELATKGPTFYGYEPEVPITQKVKETVLGTESKGIELKLVETGQVLTSDSLIGDNSLQAEGLISSNSLENNESLKEINKGLEETKSSLEKIEEKLTSISKDVAEVTKVTKNILEESGVGKPELSVRPSMEETPEDFARTADPQSAPPSAYSLPIDTVSQTIDETTKVEYQVIVGRGVKESITLMEKNGQNGQNGQNGYNSFNFELKLDPGVEIKQTIDGLIRPGLASQGLAFTDDENINALTHERINASTVYFVDSFGRYLFHFETPYMIDAAGARSSAVSLGLQSTRIEPISTNQNESADVRSIRKDPLDSCPSDEECSYILTLTADRDWLQAEERVYPILIDPTIVHENNPAFASGTENRTQVTTLSAVEGQFKELQTDINTVGLWHFNEGSSTTAYDASGNANTGTLTNGPVWNGPTDTQVGLGKSSLYFDGVNDYVTRADDSDFDFLGTDNFTVKSWFKTNGTVSAINIIAAKVSAVAGVGYKLYLDASGDVCFGTDGTAGSFPADSACTSAIDYDDSLWHHVAAVRRGTTDIRIYVDGVEVGTPDTAIGDTATLANAGALYIGIDGDGATTPFKGSIDEVRISNIARSPEEIAADASRFPYSVHESPIIDFGSTPNSLDSLTYSATGVMTGDGEKPFSSDGLVAQWNFNETSGTTAYNTGGADSCGGTPSSCNLTLNNFASTSSQDQAAGTGWTANDRRWGAGAINISSVATADTLSLSNPSTLDPNSADLSIETWVKTSDVTAELFSNNSGNGVSCTSDGYYLGIDASGYPVFTLDTDGATAGCDATITSGITRKVNDGVWHHLVATVTRGLAAYLYMDGAIIGSDTSITAYASEAPSGNVLIGSTNNFDGTLDSARFYARALTASEVLANYQSGNIEFQTRTGASADPNDGTWEAWKTTSGTGDTQIASMDTDSANWSEDNQNPASSGIVDSDDSTTKFEGTGSLKMQIGNPTVETSAVALYHLEETSGTGAYIQDSSATNADGTPTGTTVVDGFYGKARSFNGSSDYIDVGTGPTSVKSVEFWVNPTTTTEYFVNLTSTTDYIWANAGTVTATGFAAPTIYVNGAVSSTIVAGKWQHIAVTDTTAENANNLDIGRTADANYLEGKIDEVRLLNGVLAADSVAEAFRAGRDHRISKTLGTSDLSARTKLPFYVASDRPGTFLEATVGESAYANYEADANTRGLWHFEEQLDASGSIKDSSGNGNNGTLTSAPPFVQGKIGKARDFDGTADYVTVTDSSSIDISGAYSVSAWVYVDTLDATNQYIAMKGGDEFLLNIIGTNNTIRWLIYEQPPGTGIFNITSNAVLTTGTWYHIVGTWDGTTNTDAAKLYVNGSLDKTATPSGTQHSTKTGNLYFGAYQGSQQFLDGKLDEISISNTARTADEIRQAYEVGKRTHPITIDFKADLDSSNLITNTSDLSFAINPDVDTPGVGETLSLSKGEKIIVKENVNGTEYIAQGTVSAVTYANGISNANAPNQNATNAASTSVTVDSWDSGATAPSGGFTTSATVFKWQREFWDVSTLEQRDKDGITRETLRVTDGSQGATVWLDDFESADYSGGAITGSNSASIAIGSTVNRYFQYRAILSLRGAAGDAAISGGIATSGSAGLAMTSVTVNYNSGTTPQPPRTKDASTDFSATGTSLDRVTDAGSSNSPQLELSYKELSKDINTVGLWHFNEGTDNTCSGGQDACDSSGNGNHGTFNGNAAFTSTAKLGAYAGTFDGTGDYVAIPDNASTSPTNAITVEAWVKHTTTGVQDMIASKDGSTSQRSFKFSFETTNKLDFLVCADSGCSSYVQLAGTRAITDTTNWIHYAAVFKAASYVAIYINGELDAYSTTTLANMFDSTTQLEIGSRSSEGTALSLAGQIDEVRISNIARTPEEIKLDAQRRPYGVYTSDVQNLGTNVSSIDNLRWTENGVQTGDGETPYSSNGLVAAWNFNETSGTVAVNGAGSGSCGGTPSSCNGTLTTFASTTSQDQAAGTGWTKDNRKWGTGALMFDNSNDIVSVADNNSLDITTAGTLETWVKFNGLPGAASFSPIFAKGTGTGQTQWNYGLFVRGDNLKLDANIGTGAAVNDLYSNSVIKTDQWYHITYTWDGTTMKIYINGVLDNSGSQTITPVANGGSLYIGGWSTGGYPLNSTLDAPRIYSRALSANEILSNYQAGNVELQTRTGTTTTPNDGTWEEWRPSGNSTEVQLDNLQTLSPVQKINTANLVGYWKLDEVSGSRADSAGSNTLTDNATVTSKAGHLNLAGQFTSANSEYLSITDNTALSTGNIDFSLAGWVYLDSKSAVRTIASKYSTTANNREYQLLYYNTPDRFSFIVSSDGTSGNAVTLNADALGSPTTGTWYYVVAWHDATANTLNIQVNNGTINSSAHTAGVYDGTAAFQIGAETTSSQYMDGRIDEVAMWKRVLTADERRILYEDGLDKTNDSVVGGINRTSDTTTKFEGTGSEKLTIGAPQVDSSTVALWHMEETSGTGAYIQDATANNNDGTPTGTTVVDGFYGKGRSFNGSSDVITTGNIANLGSYVSASAWIKTTSTTQSVIVSQNTAASDHWFIRLLATGVIDGVVCTTAGCGGWPAGTITVNDGKWHFVALTYDGSNVKLYVDGVYNTQTGTSGTITGSSQPIKIGWSPSNDYFTGSIDEVQVSNIARSAEEIAEAFRAGRDHRITKSFGSAQDLSAKTKLPFYVASDRPGTFLEATVGESAYANYEPDSNSRALWHLEEQTGTATYIKDSSGLGNNLSIGSGTTFSQGKIGKARDFNGSSEYLECTHANCGGTTKLDTNGTSWSFGAWVYGDTISAAGASQIMGKLNSTGTTGWFLETYQQKLYIVYGNGSTQRQAQGATTISTGAWHYVVGTINNGVINAYLDGFLDATVNNGAESIGSNTTDPFRIGRASWGISTDWDGRIDEAFVSASIKTPDEIRQAYEIGKRTHQITNDFVTSPQAAYSSGTSVTINNPYGTTNLTDTLSIGETIIFKENVGGTETVSQSVVTGITNTSSVYGTVTLLAAPTFPSGGYTTNATVFKWQREFMDITGILGSPVIASGSVAISSGPNQKDAISRITLRVTDGSQGANIWLDDFKSAGPYLSVGSARTSTIASTPQQYFQYRIIFSTTDTAVSPTVTSISVQYHSDPQKVTGADTFASGTYDNDGNVQLGSNNVKDVAFYDRTKDQISYALETDGSNDYVDVGTGPTSVKTVEFWVYPETTTEYFINLTSTTDYIWVNAGTVTATGFAAPIIYVNGAVSSTLVADQWQHVVITDTTGENASNFDIGRTADTNYLEGKIDEVALFSDVRTPTEVANDYNARRLAGTEDALVAVYHFDEGSGTRAADPTGNFHGTLTNMTDDDWVNSLSDKDQSALSQQVLGVDPNWGNGPARRSNTLDMDGTGDFLTVGDSVDWEFGSGNFTVEFWVQFDAIADWTALINHAVDQTIPGRALQIGTSATGPPITARIYAGSSMYQVNSTTIPTTGIWYHLAFVRNGNNLNLYINGVAEGGTTDVTGVTQNNPAANLEIGDDTTGGFTADLNGKIDEIRISKGVARYTTSFSPSRRIKEDSNDKLLLHLDEGADNLCSGGTNDACDASSGAHDAAINGNPTWVTDAKAVMDNNARYVSLGASSAVNTDRGMELKITSTTAFQYRWSGDQTWTTPATSTLSSYSFSSPSQIDSTGVYVGFDTTNGVFGDESYFLIPSWALEQFSNSDTQNAMRGTKRGFPERSYLVATDKGVDILNADDNTLWMRMEQGSGRSLGTDFNNDPSSLFAVHGSLFVATNGSAGTGLYRFDFNRDKIYRYDATDRRTNTVNIAKRNTADSSYGSADTGQNLISSVVNDAHALTIQSKLMLAAATDTGVTKISNIMSSDTSYDYSDNASDDYGHVVLAETAGGAGDVYADNDTTDALERWNNVLDDAASETAGTPDTTYDESSTPAIFTSANEINDLKLTPQTSTIEVAPTIYIAHNAGTTVLNEKRSDPTNGSVKYLTKDYVSEELIGDTRGMWPFNGSGTISSSANISDISVKASTITAKSGNMTYVTGVRGTAVNLPGGTTDYFCTGTGGSCANNTNLNFTTTLTFSAWIKPASSTLAPIISKANSGTNRAYNFAFTAANKIQFWGSSDGNAIAINVTSNSAISNNQWSMVTVVYNGATVYIYLNGVEDINSPATASIYASTSPVLIGWDNDWMTGGHFNGVIDELSMVTEALTATQVKQLYVSGKEALNNKYRVKLASDTVNELAGDDNTVKAIAASKLNQTGVSRADYLYVGTNGSAADDGSLSRVLVTGDTRDATYDEANTEPYVVTDNDINSLSVSSDGAYIIVGSDDSGVTIIQSGSSATRMRGGKKTQGGMKRPNN